MEDATAASTSPKLKFCKPHVDNNDENKNSNSNQTLSAQSLLRKVFESQEGDWEMIGSDGKAYKFHEVVLKEQVARLRTIFAHPETKECQSKQIMVPPEVEMTGAAVEAFLRYVYYQDTIPMESSFDIVCSLIRAGHYYDISNMVDAANDALHSNGVLQQKLDWLNFEESWKLYQEVWLWEGSHPSRKNLMNNLAAILKEVSKRSAAAGSVPTGSGPLFDLIKTFIEDLPSLPPGPPPRSPSPTLPLRQWLTTQEEHDAVLRLFRERLTHARIQDNCVIIE